MKRFTQLFAGFLAFGTMAIGACSRADDLPRYDTRPENSPAEEQTAFARDLDYDILDYESYDSYNNPYTVEAPDGYRTDYGTWMRLYKTPEATYLTETCYIPQDYWYFMYNSGIAIIDPKTGDNYMLREVEHYPTDTCFWIRKTAGRFARFVLVFPPIPDNLEDIEIFIPASQSRDTFDGSARRFTGLKVSELRRSTLKKSDLKKGETIY